MQGTNLLNIAIWWIDIYFDFIWLFTLLSLFVFNGNLRLLMFIMIIVFDL